MRMHNTGTFGKQAFRGLAMAAAMAAAPAAMAQSSPQITMDTATLSVPGEYVSPIIADAENIRSLNIMLMVTSLRCRTSGHDFRGEYDLFAAAHQQNLTEAHIHLTNNLVASHGEDGSHRALDRIGVAIANRYGDGHPTMGCSQLKEATLKLAMSQDRAELALMADQLLAEGSQNAPREGQMAAVPEAAVSASPRESANPQPHSAHQNSKQNGPALHPPQPVANEAATQEQPGAARVPNWLRG